MAAAQNSGRPRSAGIVGSSTAATTTQEPSTYVRGMFTAVGGRLTVVSGVSGMFTITPSKMWETEPTL